MEALMEILENLHPEIDFNTCDTLIDDNLIDCLFEAASAFGTVGLSSGVTAMLGPTVKVVTSLTMLIGRVGPISMGMTLAAQTSELTRREVLPEAKIVVG